MSEPFSGFIWLCDCGEREWAYDDEKRMLCMEGHGPMRRVLVREEAQNERNDHG